MRLPLRAAGLGVAVLVLAAGLALQVPAVPGAHAAAPADPLTSEVARWRRADQAWWIAFTRYGADSLAAAGQVRRQRGDVVLAALDRWAQAEAPPPSAGSIETRTALVEAALLARREAPGRATRRALSRLAALLPAEAADAGLIRLAAGASAAEAGDTVEARRLLRAAAEAPGFVARDCALARLGELEAAARDTAAAAVAYQSIVDMTDAPSLRADRARVFLAAAALREARPADAVGLAGQALAVPVKGEDAALATLTIARARFIQGQVAEGRAACLRVMGDAPASVSARAAWQLLSGKAAAGLLTLSPEERLAAGTVLLRTGEETAGRALLAAVAVDTVEDARRIEAWSRQADWLFSRRRWDDARQAYQSMESVATGTPARRAEARLGQARCLRNAHQPDAMARLFGSVAADTAQATPAATALWEWAREFKSLGRFTSTDSVLTLYVNRYPYGSDILAVLLTRGICRLMLDQPGAAAADFRLLQKRAERRADKEQGAYWVARAALRQGDRAEALVQCKGATSWTLPDGYYGYRLRTLLRELEPTAQLAPPYAPLTGERPGDPLHPPGLKELPARARTHFLRGIDLARAGFEPEAQAELGRAGDLAPDDPTMFDATAAVAAREELFSAAMSAARRALGRIGGAGSETRLWRNVYALGHYDLIGPEAAANEVDPMLISGIIRQESLFDSRAVSRAGARGLMQLMLPTARQMARLKGDAAPSSDDLFRPEISVRYGARYFRDKLAESGGRVELALAAYNAGEAKANEWAALLPRWDPDLYVELIGYSETRDYVRRVRYNQATYRALYAPTGGPELE